MDQTKIKIDLLELTNRLRYYAQHLTDYQKQLKPMLTDEQCLLLAQTLLAEYDIYRDRALIEPSELTNIPGDILIG